MKQAFVDMRIRPEKMSVIQTAIRVLESYAAAGYDMTLRQLYYQMIANDLFPDSWIDPVLRTKNTQKNYKKFGIYMSDGRMIGMVDWDMMVDRTRSLNRLASWPTSASRIQSAWQTFRTDKWDNQPVRVEVWVEKEALEGVLEPVCYRNQVPFFCCRGYTSQSAMYAAAQRLSGYRNNYGQDVVILHLGDHDPSGIDMTRDIFDRLELFMGSSVEVRRIALNWEQIETYNPPPNFAKETDSRYQGYLKEFGEESFELDALRPELIDRLIQDNVDMIVDPGLWSDAVDEEMRHDELLKSAWMRWDEVTKLLEKGKR